MRAWPDIRLNARVKYLSHSDHINVGDIFCFWPSVIYWLTAVLTLTYLIIDPCLESLTWYQTECKWKMSVWFWNLFWNSSLGLKGLPAYSHHDRFPPWWGFVRDDNDGNLSGDKIPPLTMIIINHLTQFKSSHWWWLSIIWLSSTRLNYTMLCYKKEL